jgi:ketosteroid isomerase-like protein
VSQENVEIVRRAYLVFLRGEPEAAFGDFTEDCVSTRVAPMPDVVPYHGPEALLQMLAEWTEGFDEFEMHAQEFIDANDEQVLVRLHQRARGTRSGVHVEADFWYVHTMRNGKIARMDIYATKSQALKAVGLEE